jgi:hypothetical protein
MALVLSQHLDGSSHYDDHIGYLYHFARVYHKVIVPGDNFIYYCPEEAEWGRFYFGCGTIGDVMPDPESDEVFYCELLDYVPFPLPLEIKLPNGDYYETNTPVKPFFRRAVRHIPDSVYQTIIAKAGLEEDLFAGENPFPLGGDSLDPVERLMNFNHIFMTATPRQQRRLSDRIEAGTYAGRKLAELNNYTCQLCQQRGFEQKTGRPYLEAHHFLSLHKKEPKSLCSENIIVVCPGCHRMLHYAKVELEILPQGYLRLTLNGKVYELRRNTLEALSHLPFQL